MRINHGCSVNVAKDQAVEGVVVDTSTSTSSGMEYAADEPAGADQGVKLNREKIEGDAGAACYPSGAAQPHEVSQ
jgi:hypothetical protein